MSAQLRFSLSVVMARISIDNRWQPYHWQPLAVLPDDHEHRQSQTLRCDPAETHTLHPGFIVEVHADEAEGYFLNVGFPEPFVFVSWRMSEQGGEAYPHQLTLSYNEAARWMDGQEKVDGVPMPEAVRAALSQWVAVHYKPPERKRRIRPRSFESREGRYRDGMAVDGEHLSIDKERA